MRTGNPSAIAVDSENRWLFTVDAVNHRVQRFDSKGQRINSWGSLGSGDGDLRRPSNIAINVDDGWLYVVDAGNNRIIRYDTHGQFLNS